MGGRRKEHTEKPENWYDLKCVTQASFLEKQAEALAQFIESKLHYLKIEKAFAELKAPIKFKIDGKAKPVTTGNDVARHVTEILDLRCRNKVRRPAYTELTELHNGGMIEVYDSVLPPGSEYKIPCYYNQNLRDSQKRWKDPSERSLIATFYFKGSYKNYWKQTHALANFINANYKTELFKHPENHKRIETVIEEFQATNDITDVTERVKHILNTGARKSRLTCSLCNCCVKRPKSHSVEVHSKAGLIARFDFKCSDLGSTKECKKRADELTDFITERYRIDSQQMKFKP